MNEHQQTQQILYSSGGQSKKQSKDYSYAASMQMTHERETLLKQMEMLKKELTEEKNRHSNLEIVETDLVHKLQEKENQLQENKDYLAQLEETNEVNLQALDKAKKIIEKLVEESRHVNEELERVEHERD